MSKPAIVEGFTKSLAILVAIDQYVGGVPELHTPVADAEKLAEVLRGHGFKTEVVKNTDATFNKLKALLAGLLTRVGENDRVLFYFAGHGIALPSDDGPRGYILPQDADRNSDKRYLSMVDLNKTLSALSCRHMLVILDCCFAGALRWASTRDLVFAPANLHRERYEWFIHDAAWQAIASAAHDQKALDVAAGQPLGARDQATAHSPFAEALIDGLAGAADLHRADQPTGDGVITATELLLYLEDRLMPPPGSGRPRQTPILWPLKKHDKGQFVFLVPGKELNLPPAPSLDLAANPWRGLQSYESSHHDLFFGRRKVSEALVERVLRDPLVVVTGPSGIGKSSLVRAGLLPRLELHRIKLIVIRPGPAPFVSLSAALRGIGRSDVPAPDEPALKTDPMAFAKWIVGQGDDGQILLVIDQAEELITQNRNPEVARDFLTLISNALDQTKGQLSKAHSFTKPDARVAMESMGYVNIAGLKEDDKGIWRAAALRNDMRVSAALDFEEKPLRVVFAVRSEFEPQFAQSSLKERWPDARYLVPQMTQDELRRVIEGPAAVKVMRFESADLVDRLVNEVVQMPGALPLLSFALSEMYKKYLERRSVDRTIAFEDYRALQGGITGSLKLGADKVIDELGISYQPTARRLLERLVSIEAGEYARRRVPRRDFEAGDPAEDARVALVLSRLDEARLVITDKIENEPHLELAHDALILGWDKLLNWVREDAPLITDLRDLSRDAKKWELSGKQRSAPLWDNPAQIEAIGRLESTLSPGLNFLEREFAVASRKRASQRWVIWWSTAAVLVLLALGAVGFAYQAIQERGRAVLELDRAFRSESLALSQLSERETQEGNAVNGVLLALAALPSKDINRPLVEEADQALRSGFFALQERRVVQEYASSISFSPSGTYYVSYDNSKYKIWKTDTGSFVSTVGTGRLTSNVVFTPDERVVMTLESFSSQTTVNLWDPLTGEKLGAISQEEETTDASISPNGTRVITRSSKFIKLWDTSTRMAIATIQEPAGRATRPWPSFLFSSDGSRVYFRQIENEMQLWNSNVGSLIKAASFDGDVLAIQADGKALVRSSSNLELWDLAGSKRLTKIPPLAGTSETLVFSRNGRLFAQSHQNYQTVNIYDTNTGQKLAELQGHEGGISYVEFSRDESSVITAAQDGTVRIWNAVTGKMRAVLRGHRKPVVSAALSSDGLLVVSTDADTIRLWKAQSGLPDLRLRGHTGPSSIRVSKDGKLLVTGSTDHTARIWDLESGKLVAKLEGHKGAVYAVAFDANAERVLTGSGDGTAKVWNASSGHLIATLVGHTKAVYSVAFSPKGDRLLTASADRTGRIWDSSSFETLNTLIGHDEEIYAASFDVLGNHVATTSFSERFVWNAHDGQPLVMTRRRTENTFSYSFTPDGKKRPIALSDALKEFWWDVWQYAPMNNRSPEIYGVPLLLGSEAYSISTSDEGYVARVYRHGAINEYRSLRGHGASITAAAISADSRFVATAANDQTIKLWSLTFSTLLATFTSHQKPVFGLIFSSNGELLASTGDDNEIRVWRLFPNLDKLVKAACEALPRELSPEDRTKFNLEKSPSICKK